jgi:hypothetical protein
MPCPVNGTSLKHEDGAIRIFGRITEELQ